MDNALFFEIPDNQRVMEALVEAVPSTWAWVDGGLWAPAHLLDSGEALQDTGFAISRFHIINPTIVGRYLRDENKKTIPDFFGIIVERKLPGFVSFDEAGYQSDIVTFALAKRIAVGMLGKNYRGSMTFYKDCHDNSKYANPARCSIQFSSWQGAPFMEEESGMQPARLKAQWDERYHGKEQDLDPIVAVCRALGLREYIPQAQPRT